MLCEWFLGSRIIKLDSIIGYYEYSLPLFEFHIEMNYLGAKLKRNEIGEFYYISPGIRKGLIIEYTGKGKTVEKLFISPKNPYSFIDEIRHVLMLSYNKKIEEYKDKFYIN